MTADNRFGGVWTREKLERLSKYLSAYMTIFKKNERARWFTTNYVDAFAGTGFRSDSHTEDIPTLFEDEEAAEFQRGSAAIALESEPPFDKYLFIDIKHEHIKALTALKNQYPKRDVQLVRDDANRFLPKWCHETDWEKNRAVVFLDPYGTQVDWVTIEGMAKTKAVDLWLLFPLGQAVNRMLTRCEPDTTWAARLDRIFGTKDWRDEFYQPSDQVRLFGKENISEKVADFDTIGKFFVRRLQTVFAQVAEKPLALTNSRNIPIYLLCFASANPRGAGTAVRIANHILES